MTRILLLAFSILISSQSILAQQIGWTDLPSTPFAIGPFRVVDDSAVYALKHFDWDGEPVTTPLLKSTDAGRSWKFSLPWGEVYLDTNNTGHHGVWAFDIFFHDAETGWASTSEGLQVTTDSGKTWRRTSFGIVARNGSRFLFLQFTDSTVIVEHRRSTDYPMGLFSINRYTGKLDTLAWRADLQKSKVDGVKSALILRDTCYVGGYSADGGTYLAIRDLHDTIWTSIPIDSSSRLNPYLRIHNNHVVVACDTTLYSWQGNERGLESIATLFSPIKELHVLSSGESIVMHPSEPFISISPKDLTDWIPAGRPLLPYGTLTTHGDILYHYRNEGSWLQRGQIVEGKELGLFMHPTMRTMTLKALGGLDTIAGALVNYSTSNLRVQLQASSGQLFEFDPSWIDVPSRSKAEFTAIIRSIINARDTARVSGIVSGYSHALGIWDLQVSELKSVERPVSTSLQPLLYPNPARELLQIDSRLDILHVNISDALGRLMEVRRSGNSIDVSDLPVGAYYLTCSTEHGTSTQAFVVSR